MNWFVFHTRPKNEKKVAESLLRGGYEVYLPLMKTLKQWSDRKKKIEEPLYKSYVFFRGTEAERQEAIKTSGVVRCLYYLGEPALVRDTEIEAIKTFLGELDDYPEAELFHFDLGQMVEIKSGMLKGVQGEYLSRNGDDLFLRIESLGRIVQAKVPVRYVVD